MRLQLCRVIAALLAVPWIAGVAGAEPAPAFEDLLTDNGGITGQWGGGTFSGAGYTLTHSGGDDPNGSPRSVDFVWYDLPGVGADGSGSIEFDVVGLYPSAGAIKNELAALCDGTGINPATTGGEFYASAYYSVVRKDNSGSGNTDKMKIAAVAHQAGFEDRTNVLSWSGTTTKM